MGVVVVAVVVAMVVGQVMRDRSGVAGCVRLVRVALVIGSVPPSGILADPSGRRRAS